RHVATVERLHAAADRLEYRLLARPGAQERTRAILDRQRAELLGFAAAEEAIDQGVRVRDWPGALHVHPEPGPADGNHRQPGPVRQVELQAELRGQVRLAPVGIADRNIPRPRPGIVAAEPGEGGPGGDGTVAELPQAGVCRAVA